MANEEVVLSNVQEPTMVDGADERGRDATKKTSKRAKSRDPYAEWCERLAKVEETVIEHSKMLEEDVTPRDEFTVWREEFERAFQASAEKLNGTVKRLDRLVNKLVEVDEAVADVRGELEEVRALTISKDARIAALEEELKELKGEWSVYKRALLTDGAPVMAREVAPRVEAPKPKPYGGKRDAKELDAFLWNIERYCRHLKIVDGEAMVNTASLYLQDNALLWWKRKDNEIKLGLTTINTWEDFVKEIKAQFYPEHAEFQAREKLRWLKHSGSLKDYVNEYASLLLEISDMSEKDKLFHFMSGLQQWARSELERRGVQNLNQAISVAESLIDYGKDDGRPKERWSSPTKSGGDKDREKDRWGSPSKRDRDKGKSDRGRTSKEDHTRKDKTMDRSEDKGKKPCFLCNKEGHVAYNCPKRGKLSAILADYEPEEEAKMGTLKLLNAVQAKASTSKGETNGRRGLMFVEARVNGGVTQALVDTGATHNFISVEEAERLKLKVSKEHGRIKSVNSDAKSLVGIAHGVELKLDKWKGSVDLMVVPLDDYKLVLGADFMDKEKAFPMVPFDILCIVGEGPPCLVPMKRGRDAGKVLSTMELDIVVPTKGKQAVGNQGESPHETNKAPDNSKTAKTKELPKCPPPRRKVDDERKKASDKTVFDREVEDIVAEGIVRRIGTPTYKEYLVLWKGLPETEASWVAEDSLWRYKNLIDRYHTATRTLPD